MIGGIESVIENLFEGLQQSGHDVRLVTASASAGSDGPGIFRASKKGLKSFLWFSLRKGISL